MSDDVPFNHDRFPVCLLTREAAEKMGHVAWIEDSDPVNAIRRMHEAVAKGAFNAAVWADAGKLWKPEDLAILRKWREAQSLKGIRTLIYPPRSAEEARAEIDSLFNKEGEQIPPCESNAQAVQIMRDHMKARISQLAAAFSPSRFHFDLRTSQTELTDSTLSAHVDGPGFGPWRFIESVESPGTCLIDNRDVRASYKFSGVRPAFFHSVKPSEMRYDLKDKARIVFWQVPTGSLSLLSNSSLERQPIMHSRAPTPRGGTPSPRTLFVFDLTD